MPEQVEITDGFARVTGQLDVAPGEELVWHQSPADGVEREHIVDDYEECWCNPEVITVAGHD